ncbi:MULTISPECIES: hypothetical protein [Lacticaseibacillus]|uniref:hypothetical protein n=1 Tax=Lacticaseibacillus TaxID=2759736 RepID=UPI000F76B5F6|nr:hypothetical protein [Lacticaseibacillus suibinensis]
MLNFHDQQIQQITTTALNAADARRQVTAAYAKRTDFLRNDPLWQGNLPAIQATTLSYTALLADKLLEALRLGGSIAATFVERLWFQPAVGDGDRSTITIYLASPDKNQELLVIDGGLTEDGHLIAKNLPTLLQITAKDPDLGYPDDEVRAMSQMIKVFYTAGLRFRTIDETVLQPVDGLAFTTKFDNGQPLATMAEIKSSGNVKLSLPLDHNNVVDYSVLDDNKHDWKDLGTSDVQDDTFTWASTTIPDELVGQRLRLRVQVQASQSSPALDELFVIASTNAILMRQGSNRGQYAVDLPNHNVLTVTMDPARNQLALSYPEKTVQLIELDNQYPFIGEWLKSVLPQRRAFN